MLLAVEESAIACINNARVPVSARTFVMLSATKPIKQTCYCSLQVQLYLPKIWNDDQASKEHASSEAGNCRTPTLNEVEEDNELKKILDTHIWKVVEAKKYGEGFEVRVECSRCGLGRITIIYNIKESAKVSRALEEDRYHILK